MRKWWLAPVIGAGLLAATVGVSAFAVTTNQSAKKAEVYQQLDLFADILAKAQADYVTASFDTNEAVEAAINGMLASLSTRTRPISTPKISRTCRRRPPASTVVSASKSPRRTAS